ncbi:2-polyprenyl-6-methoxyphenol hydroxylase-like oxidoreductase [Frankia sp. AiPs1]|uniref:FAD-dependent monooxygenase n=1 Tax=Frankia sp. AiPa1 TaxID=573492 RepID=UPI00202B851D|nr:FAD-dependent monooxygenase [Frankia sp. AiPa1]MCL9759063.1 FAD-dependent monooxygenase [Frankia sp. AiPa1]
MRIVCVGGGPAGLYFAIAAKLRNPGHEITVFERNPPGATYGWGVVYWDNLLDVFFHTDPRSARQIRARSALWQEQRISLGGQGVAHLTGYGFSIQRAELLRVLAGRAVELGVRVVHRQEVDDLTPYADADLIVAADGANSRVRQAGGDLFGTSVTRGTNPYLWLGTDRFSDSFTFAFERTAAGWIWCHAYPSNAGLSTFIVECTERTWQGLGFDSRGGEETLRILERIFAEPLGGHALVSQAQAQAEGRAPGTDSGTARWQRFVDVTNQCWYHGNVVLVGDAAHTTHFTLGSGTALAIVDAVMLARILHGHANDARSALREFDNRGRRALRPMQAAARTSMTWFEQADRYLGHDVVSFAYTMAGRQGRQPPWRQPMHRATQVPAVRGALRGLHSGTRWYLARRRGEPIAARCQPSLKTGSGADLGSGLRLWSRGEWSSPARPPSG